MSWGTKGTSSALTLTAAYATVQESAADLEISLSAFGDVCEIIADVDFQGTPTEDCDLVILRSVDGTEYETAGEGERHIISVANRETDDPAERSIWVDECYGFKVQARVRDTDDTIGGDDTTTTLTIHHRVLSA